MNESGAEWNSPDDKIFKVLKTPGIWGQKPYDGSIVKLKIISGEKIFNRFDNVERIVGDSDSDLDRLFDICICTMHLNEIATFTITLDLEQYTATIQLVAFDFKGFVYEWDAKVKMSKALALKEKGIKHFKGNNDREALHKFTKAIKLVLSIPINAECVPDTVDDVKIVDINALKENLYNNIATCYFRHNIYEMVTSFCEKVLKLNPNNVKALYKIGIAYEYYKDYDKANEMLSKLMELEPENKACEHHLTNVRKQIKQANIRVDNMFKKMISGSIGT